MTQDLQPVELTVVDTNTAEWVGFPIPELGVDLELIPLIADPDTGMQVFKTVYRAGFTNEWHTHPCVLTGEVGCAIPRAISGERLTG